MTEAYAIKSPEGKIVSIGESEIYAWANVSSQYSSHEGLAAKGYTCVPVTVNEKGYAEALLREASMYLWRSDNQRTIQCAERIDAYLSRRQG